MGLHLYLCSVGDLAFMQRLCSHSIGSNSWVPSVSQMPHNSTDKPSTLYLPTITDNSGNIWKTNDRTTITYLNVFVFLLFVGQSDSEDGDDDLDEKLGSNDEEDAVEKVPNEKYTTSPVTENSSDLNKSHRKYSSASSHNDDATSCFSNEKVTENCVSPSELEFLKSLSFPSDILILKKVEGEEALRTGRPYVVCTEIPLQKGSSIGPFRGEHVSLSSVRQGDLVLQVRYILL